MKRRIRSNPVSSDRWLVSYADLITLLFALFVILYATSQSRVEKFKVVHESLRNAFAGKTTREAPPAMVVDSSGKPIAENSLEHTKNLLEQELPTLGSSVQMLEDERGLVVRLAAKDFFDDASAEPRAELVPLLLRIGRVLVKLPNEIRIEGFSDAIEEKQLGKNHDAWVSDWELSSARATGVVRLWIEQLGMNPKKIGAAGFSHFRPLSDKTDIWSRGLNRRIEVVVVKPK